MGAPDEVGCWIGVAVRGLAGLLGVAGEWEARARWTGGGAVR
ncbi:MULTISPECIES: hypothetical protein [unclassified Streptomyces]